MDRGFASAVYPHTLSFYFNALLAVGPQQFFPRTPVWCGQPFFVPRGKAKEETSRKAANQGAARAAVFVSVDCFCEECGLRPAAIGLTRAFVVAVGCVVLHFSGLHHACLLASLRPVKKTRLIRRIATASVFLSCFLHILHLLRHSQGVAVPVHLPQFWPSPQWPPVTPRAPQIHASTLVPILILGRKPDHWTRFSLAVAAFLFGRPCSLLSGLPRSTFLPSSCLFVFCLFVYYFLLAISLFSLSHFFFLSFSFLHVHTHPSTSSLLSSLSPSTHTQRKNGQGKGTRLRPRRGHDQVHQAPRQGRLH